MSEPLQASLTWKLRQGQAWLVVSITMPASSASRVGCTLLREFADRRATTPAQLDITGEVKRFSYVSDRMTLALRRLKAP